MTLGSIGSTVALGVVSFVTTNIDDLLVLSLFFAQRGRDLANRHVIIGQYLGFAVLVGISCIGLLFRQVADQRTLGYLGLCPMLIGLRMLLRRPAPTLPPPAPGAGAAESAAPAERPWRIPLLDRRTVLVATVTIANGGDNIGVYIPIFARSRGMDFALILLVYAILVAVWCLLAMAVARHRLVRAVIAGSRHYLLPLVLMLLGFWILYSAGSLGPSHP